jgi:hypothetical protein
MLINIPVTPFYDKIAQSGITNHSIVNILGRRQDISADSDIWSTTATTMVYPVDAGEQVTVVSSSASDTSAGTGARIITLEYLDATGNEQTTNITLNGTTPVNSTPTNIRFINMAYVSSTGTGLLNAGNISIYKTGTAASVYAYIPVGFNNDLSAIYMVPLGKKLYINNLVCGLAGPNKYGNIVLFTNNIGDTVLNNFIPQSIVKLFQGSISINYSIPIALPALSKFKVRSFQENTSYSVEVQLRGYLKW